MFEDIQRQDPDGKATEPTEADYWAFREWVIVNYGANVYRAYMSPNRD